MIARDETLPTRVELSGSQRALLEERLQRARQLGGKVAEPRASIPRRTSDDNLPLSFAQERLWFIDQLEPGSPVYNMAHAIRMRGALDVAALEQSLNEIVRRHEALRTNFVPADDEGRAIQVIAPTRQLAVPLIDLSGYGDNADEELKRRLETEGRRPFDFTRDMLIRALLVRRSPSDHTLMLTMHHIISDGWSMGVLFRELASLYAAFVKGEPSPLPELPVQFADFVLWERENLQGPSLEKLLAYWKKQLAGPLPVLELPVDHPRTLALTSRGASESIVLSREVSQKLKSLGQHEGASLFMTLLAAFNVLLYRWTGQEDILVGSVVAGRRKVELEKLIGFFVSTLVFRGDLSGTPSFRALLGRIKEMALGAFAHQELPFEHLVKELRPDRTLSRNPLFQVMFVLQNAPMSPAPLPELAFESLELDTGTAKFDLTLAMGESPHGLCAALEYNAALFDTATIQRLLRSFETLLTAIVANPDESIATLPLLTERERQQILVEWNNTALDYPRDACIHELFEAQARQTPNACAVVGERERLTYGELNRRADRLAARLRELGVGAESLVGIFLHRTPQLLVGMLGVLKAGGAYVPLDPAYPAERLNFIADDARMPVIVTERALLGTLPAKAIERIVLDDEADLARERRAVVARATEKTGPTNLAYIIYTSGSTGRPKGVAVMHRGVVALSAWAKQLYRPEELAGVLFSTSVCFDVSVFESLVPLSLGGKIIVAENLLQVGSLPAANEVTLVSGVPSAMAEVVRGGLLPSTVRTVNVAGEPCPQSLVEAAYALGHVERIYDVYGPTETTVYSTGSLRKRGGQATIGRPLPNEQAYILDRHLQPVPIGVRGELLIGGDKVARGYLNRPELTAEKFIELPWLPGQRLYRTGDGVRYRSDGNIEYLGRLDRQVKIRGYRIEPAEIEAVLAQNPNVKECAVVVRDDPSGGKYLAAYIVPKLQPAPAVDTWRTYLEGKLPEYLVPSSFMALDAMPLAPNGKINVHALPAIELGRRAAEDHYVAPRNATEQELAQIWEQVLGVKPIGVQDRFFDLGGHSLLAVRLVAQIEKKFGKKLPIAAIFQHRTIEQLAVLLGAEEQRPAAATSIVEIQGKGTKPPIYLVHGAGGGMFWGYSNLARHLGSDQPVFAFKSRGLDGVPEWPTIEEMAAAYIADLRAHHPHGPYLLGGYCFGGVVAYEMARQLHAQGERVALLGMLNCSPPNTGYDQVPNPKTWAWRLKFLRNFCYWIGCFLFSWTMRERVEFVRWKFKILRKRSSGPIGATKEITMTDVDEMVNLAAYSDRQRAVWQAHVQALVKYRPKPYPGAVTLFRTRGHALRCSFDEHYGWGELALGGVRLRMMPGGHGNILDEPHVRAVAVALRETLDAAARKGEAGA